SGYMPLGATIVTDEIAKHFDTHPLVIGGTYSSHTLACATALACIEVYEEEGLIDNAAKLGETLGNSLRDLQAEHPRVTHGPGIGLFYALELVKNRETRAPMSEFNKPVTEPMKKLEAELRAKGLFNFNRWNMIFIVPPLIINEQQLQEGLSIINDALSIADKYVE